jgi:hypothetical protein
METVTLEQLLEKYSREEVKQILVDSGIARNLIHAEFMIAVSLKEILGDVTITEDAPDEEPLGE